MPSPRALDLSQHNGWVLRGSGPHGPDRSYKASLALLSIHIVTSVGQKLSHKTSQEFKGKGETRAGSHRCECRETWAHWGTTTGRKDYNVYVLACAEESKQQRKKMK